MRKIKMLKDIFALPDGKLKQKIRQDFAGYVKACYKIEQSGAMQVNTQANKQEAEQKYQAEAELVEKLEEN